MKKLWLMIFFFACVDKKTPQQKAETSVKKYIKDNAHDASSYKPMSFGKLDSIYAIDTTGYLELDFIRRGVVLKYNDAKNNGRAGEADSLRQQLLHIDSQMDAGKTFDGLKIYHVSQGKNELGDMVMNRGSFYLDSNYLVKEFISTEDSLMNETDAH